MIYPIWDAQTLITKSTDRHIYVVGRWICKWTIWRISQTVLEFKIQIILRNKLRLRRRFGEIMTLSLVMCPLGYINFDNLFTVLHMMMLHDIDTFRITVPLCREYTGHPAGSVNKFKEL